jgi:hypothetical protein
VPIFFLPHWILRREIHKVLAAIQTVAPEGAAAAQLLFLGDDSILVGVHSKVPDNVAGMFGSRVLVWRIYYVVALTTVIFMATSPHWIIASTMQALLELMRLMARGIQRHALAIEIINFCAIKIISRSWPLSYLSDIYLQDRFVDTFKNITRYDNFYLSGVDEVAADHGMMGYVRASDECTRKYLTCWGKISHIDEFIELSNRTFYGNFELNSDEFQRMTELLLFHVSPYAEQTRLLDMDLCESYFSVPLWLASSSIVVASVFLFSVFVIDRYLLVKVSDVLRTSVLLVRHLPPSILAATPDILQIFVPQTVVDSSDSGLHGAQTIIHHCSTPVMFLGEHFVIEWVNPAFRKSFTVASELLGHSLDVFIPRTHHVMETWGGDDAFLFDGLDSIYAGKLDRVHCMTKCIADGQSIPIVVTAFAVDSTRMVLFIESELEAKMANKTLKVIQRHCENLQHQLIPKEATHYDTATFMCGSATIVAVQIEGVVELVKQSYNKFEVVIELIETIAKKNPPVILLKTVFNTLYLVSGLFEGEELTLDHASPALSVVKRILSEVPVLLTDVHSDRKFGVAIVEGGPLLCMTIGTESPRLEVVGAAIDLVTEMVAFAAGQRVLVAEEFKDLFAGTSEVEFVLGPTVLRKNTAFMVYNEGLG